jgi:inhibitor of KinA sporulation pathway (predicted exonuclease)
MPQFGGKFVIWDVEYTSWEGAMARNWSGPNEFREVIQIGAIKVDGTTLTEEGSYQMYVKPVKNPELSDFITNLTGITQADVDTKGVALADALASFKTFAAAAPLYSFGIDAENVEANCKLLGIDFPFAKEECHDLYPILTQVLAARSLDITKYHSGTLIEAFGKKGGRAHDALNDVRNLLLAIRELKN